MNSRTLEIEGPHYKFGSGEIYFEETEAIAELLLAETLFLGGKGGPFFEVDGDQEVAAIYVNCNDLWMWACADAEPLPMSEIENLYKMWVADPKWGTWKWACKKRNLAPQRPIVKDMKKDGAWCDEMKSLPKPPRS